MIKNQKGFTALEIVLVIITLVAVSAAGYYAYQARQEKADSKVSITKSEEKTQAKTTISQNDKAVVSQKVKDYYNKYVIPKYPDDYPAGASNRMLSDGYITANLSQQFKTSSPYDLPTCSQNKAPNYVFSDPTINSNKAEVIVTGSGYDSEGITIKVQMVKDSSSWKIDSFNCT